MSGYQSLADAGRESPQPVDAPLPAPIGDGDPLDEGIAALVREHDEALHRGGGAPGWGVGASPGPTCLILFYPTLPYLDSRPHWIVVLTG